MSLMAGTPDIGGLRASLAMVAADELGVPYDKVRPIIGDTGSLGFNFLTGGSRSTFSGAMAIVEAAQADQGRALRARRQALGAAKPDQVEFEDGAVRPLGALAEQGQADVARGLRQDRRQDRRAHRRLRAHQRPGRGPELRHPPGRRRGRSRDRARRRSCATRWPRTRARRVHPSYVEGQFQGGAVQGIGWALNEEYIYGADGKLQNAGFLDYRMPVASDVPMIDAIIVEVPNPQPSLRRARRRRDARSCRRWRPSPTPWRTPPASASPSCRCRRPRCSRRSRSKGAQRRPEPARAWREWCWSATSRSSRGASPSSSSRRRP